MAFKQKIMILGTGFACGVILVLLIVVVFFNGGHKNRTSEATTPKIEEAHQKEISSLKQELSEAENALKRAQIGQEKQKISELQNAAQSLFKVYYDYDQHLKNNKERQQEVKGVVSSKVARQLFPLEADQLKSDYGTIQSYLNHLNVYVQVQMDATLTAFVDCDYTASAGQLTSHVSHYIFQVTYDTNAKKITAVTELGKVGK
ncbi:hypothetical protein [Lactococcus taiwanensis]|uniref:hypothetical protein n=1 Tax=Lactococcus taiwanensis TaxID=1151742 RepID=UPI0035180749